MKNIQLDKFESEIKQANTREYFKEVISSYYNENYRSAIVMLYSIVICDLLLKLHELRDRYDDSRARTILKEIEQMQKNNPSSPEWEKALVQKMLDSRYVIDVSSFAHIGALRDERNLCAHPVLKDSLELFRPNKEAVYGHIQNALDDILTKSSLYGNKSMTDNILNDMASCQNSFMSKSEIQTYLDSKYLDRIDNEDEEFRIFNALWKLVFKTSNEECDRNRYINLLTLDCIYQHNEISFRKRIKDNINSLASKIDFSDETKTYYLIRFINYHPYIYSYFENDSLLILNAKVKEYRLANICLFLHDDIKSFLLSSKSMVRKELSYIARFLKDTDNRSLAIDFLIHQYGISANYDQADMVFTLLEGGLQYASHKQIKELLDVSNENDQIYQRRNFQNAINGIVNIIKSKEYEFNFKEYKNLKIQ